MDQDLSFAVIGGDLRQVRLSYLLARDGYNVTVFAQERVDPDPLVKTAQTLESALKDKRYVILPLPCLASDATINAPFSDEKIEPKQIFQFIPPGGTVFCGLAATALYDMAQSAGITLLDFAAQEEFSVYNAVSTAEGALQIAFEEMPITLHGANCLIIGFGRLGKVLASDMKSLGARVTVAARKCSDRAWIKNFGYTPTDIDGLLPLLPGFDLIVNTVPALILDRKALSLLRSDCLCIDLASKPGGIDFAEASALGIRCIWALSLPGKVAPYTSGQIVRDTIYNMLSERNVRI